MRIFTIIFCLFLSVDALGQSKDTVYVDSHKRLGLKNGDKQAYIEVDGKPYNGRLESIDTSKVSSVSVLKPEDAANLYGPKGANGAILITTKGINSTPQNISFKCLSTITKAAEPLYIIDGKVSKEGIAAINPDSISVVNVLKGEKAIALYGKAGVNGVVLLTTIKAANKPDSTKATKIVFHDGPPVYKSKILFVIDGKQIYTTAADSNNMPNPNDILSMDVLKPAIALAKYGKLGTNGAIIIGTKNGNVSLELIKAIKWSDVDKERRPLIIFDGAPYSHTIKTLNANDIANIQILRADAAKAIYSNEGKNGAVIITSKNYYIFYVENELSIKFKRYRKLLRKSRYHIRYAVNNTLLKGNNYEVAKQVFDIPEKEIIKLYIKKIHKPNVDSLAVNIKTK